MTRKILFVLVCMLSALALYANVPLLEQGKSGYALCIDREDDGEEEGVFTALEEFKDVFKKISGVELERVPVAECKQKAIHFRTDDKLKESEIHIFTEGENLIFAGGRGHAVFDAVCYFFQTEFGVRWLWPGEDGEYIPKTDSKTLPDKYEVRFTPSIPYRGFHLCGDWYKVKEFCIWAAHNFINVNRHRLTEKGRFVKMESNHSVFLDHDLLQEHPEYFAEIDGKRYASQVCMCNDTVDQLIYERMEEVLEKNPDMEIFSVFPSDNQEYCQCAKCKAKGVSTAWFDFYNRLTDKLKAKFPDVKFSTIAYQGYIDVPKNPVRNSVFIEFASYPRCNIHPYGHPDCEHNEKTLALMKAWKATGTPMGHYGYEFDVFSSSLEPFPPFYTVIQDAVKTSVELDHKLVMTEVGLSPRNGPDIKSGTFRNRLACYLYAQLMWNHKADMKAIIADWCRAAYGPAAQVMTEYYLYLDHVWGSMHRHWGILGNPANLAPSFVTPEVIEKVKGYFAEADKCLNKQPCKALAFEKQLWAQWLSLVKTGRVELAIPKLKGRDAFKYDGAFIGDTGVRMAWTQWNVRIGPMKPPFVVKLSAGMGTASYFFAMTSSGKMVSWRISEVGVKENLKSDAWTYKDDVLVIPFEMFDFTPSAGDKWDFKFKLDKMFWPSEKADASLVFSGSATVGHSIFWAEGAKDAGLVTKLPGLQKSFEDAGWSFQLAQTGNDISKADTEVYFFRYPGFKDVLNAEHYGRLRKKVEDGAIAVFYTYHNVPLEKIFNDPKLKIRMQGCGPVPLSKRVSKYVKKGQWLDRPNEDLEKSIRRGLTPAYNFVMENPDQWIILATEPLTPDDNGPDAPYLMFHPHGKGAIVMIAADPRFNIPSFLGNLIVNRAILSSDFKQKK